MVSWNWRSNSFLQNWRTAKQLFTRQWRYHKSKVGGTELGWLVSVETHLKKDGSKNFRFWYQRPKYLRKQKLTTLKHVFFFSGSSIFSKQFKIHRKKSLGKVDQKRLRKLISIKLFMKNFRSIFELLSHEAWNIISTLLNGFSHVNSYKRIKQ